MNSHNFINLIGKKFGKLSVVKYVGKNKYGKPLWLCKCDCGNEKVIIGNSLVSNRTKSCGCLYKKHGYTRTPTYIVWSDMKRRCLNPKHKNYKWYGERGITVCERWLKFENFLKDMGERPEGKSLDRIDNNRLINSYSPENCRWTTNFQQHRNMRSNINVPLNGKSVCLKDYCKIKNLNYNVVMTRIDTYGWSIEEALTIPIRKRKNKQ